MLRSTRESIIKIFFFVCALVSILVLGLIIIFLFMEGLPLFRTVSPGGFLFGRAWYPTYDPPSFGIWPLIVGSIIVTLFSSLIAIPMGILAAIYIAELASPPVKELFKPVVELLAGLPSASFSCFCRIFPRGSSGGGPVKG